MKFCVVVQDEADDSGDFAGRGVSR